MKKQNRYTPEFRAEAVKLVTEQGLSQEAASSGDTLLIFRIHSKLIPHRSPLPLSPQNPDFS